VERATSGADVFDRRPELRKVDHQRVAAALLRHLLRPRPVSIGDHNVRATAAEAQGGGAANTARAPGHENAPAAKVKRGASRGAHQLAADSHRQ
jgi:hypothetical protein